MDLIDVSDQCNSVSIRYRKGLPQAALFNHSPPCSAALHPGPFPSPLSVETAL